MGPAEPCVTAGALGFVCCHLLTAASGRLAARGEPAALNGKCMVLVNAPWLPVTAPQRSLVVVVSSLVFSLEVAAPCATSAGLTALLSGFLRTLGRFLLVKPRLEEK